MRVAPAEVLLCAGAVQSPHVLMLSGLGPKAHLEQFGVPVRKDLPGPPRGWRPTDSGMAPRPPRGPRPVLAPAG